MLTVIENASQQKFDKKSHFKLLSPLFKKAGVVREAQVNLNLVSKHNASYLIPYIAYLVRTQQVATEDLIKETEVFNKSKLTRLNESLYSEVKGLSDLTIEREAANYILNKLRKVSILKEIKNDSKLHKIRIHLRPAGEILKLAVKLKASAEMDELKYAIKTLNKLIGKWHDYKVLIDSLKLFIEQNPQEKCIDRLNNLIPRIGLRNEATQQDIYGLLHVYAVARNVELLEKRIDRYYR